MKLVKLSLIFLSMFLLISVINATITFSPASPLIINTSCGESAWEDILLVSGVPAECEVSLGARLPYQLNGLYLAAYSTGMLGGDNSKLWLLHSVDANTCESGSEDVIIDVCGTDYPITINVGYDFVLLDDAYALSEGQRFSIGDNIHFNLINVGSNYIDYSLEGCSNPDTRLNLNGVLEVSCGTERLKVEINEIMSNSVASFDIYFSTDELDLHKSDSDIDDIISSDCELGLDTLGAKVRRGNIFAIKTINANSGGFEQGVGVTILDQEGELSPIAGVSSNIGFFSMRLHEDYEADLIVQLEKDDCEPSTQIILFEVSYDDYKKEKGKEEGEFQLVLNMSERYELKVISGTIKNELNEVVEEVEVKITQPDNSIITVLSNDVGIFKFTPIKIGEYKLIGGKDDYVSTGLVYIEVFQNKQYLIVIKVDGESKSTYKPDDRITFELRNENNTLIPISLSATFAGQPLNFISGISDPVIFKDTSTLVIPAKEGYLTQSITLPKDEGGLKILFWIAIIVGIIIILFVIGLIIKRVKGRGVSPQMGTSKNKMAFQLGREGEGNAPQ